MVYNAFEVLTMVLVAKPCKKQKFCIICITSTITANIKAEHL